MRALNSQFVLINVQSSWSSAKQIPISAFAYLHTSRAGSPAFSEEFRRTCRGRNRNAISSSIQSPEIRRPRDRTTRANWLKSISTSSPSPSTSSSQDAPVSDMDLFLQIVPSRMRNELVRHEEIGELIEIVMDLGRKPLARFPSGDWVVSDQPVKLEDLRHAISKVGDFSDDNRSGIDNSLHRISAIRNRKMQIIGLTCRVGRAVSGSAEIIRDLIEGGGSILVIGPPGVGKTTLIREIARMLADDQKKRVVIVDTSNEIGGDGDVPHCGIGLARRMQVPNVNMQHNVMIEAVENHMPQSIIIDEIGTELEALAASTIAQRGVQLVGTAHGTTIESIIKNPSLQLLVGGIESVTLGDEEARKRKVQKTILERKGPSTFTCAVEMISRTECRVHHRLDATVDAILAGKSPLFEIRQVEAELNTSMKSSSSTQEDHADVSKLTDNKVDKEDSRILDTVNKDYYLPFANDNKNVKFESDDEDEDNPKSKKSGTNGPLSKRTSPLYVYTHKIQEADLLEVTTAMGLEDEIDATDDIGAADAILATSTEMKQNPWIRSVAKFHQVPVFVIKSNTMAQMVKAARMILGMHSSSAKQPLKNAFDIEIEDDAPKRKPTLEEIDALEEVRLAIEYIVIPGGEPVELLPRRSEIVAQQVKLVESYQLAVENSGTELNPRLQILPQKLNKASVKHSKSHSSQTISSGISFTTGTGGATVARLPLLPE
nr:P-loop containing nucleoside triphosphate hydrolase protein [Ipomoea batatas]